MSAKSANLVGLTSLRGIAAMGIVVHHCVALMFPDLHSLFIPDRAISKLYLFVDLFFILSGFVLTHVYCDRFVTGFKSYTYREFMLARFARIYPLHLFILLVFLFFQLFYVVVVNGVGHSQSMMEIDWEEKRTLWSFLGNVFLLQGFPANGSWNEPAWSISAEWFTYLFIPFLVAFVQGINQSGKIMVFSLCVVSLVLIELVKGDLGMWWGGWPLMLRCLVEASMGIVLYKWYQDGLPRQIHIDGSWVTGIFFAIGVSFALPIPHVITVLLFTLLILAAGRIHENSSHWLLNRALVYLGIISYSIYMTHWFVKQLIMEPAVWFWGALPGDLLALWQQLGVLILTLVMVVLCSHCCYRWIETPWRKRIVHSVRIRRILDLV